MENLLIKLVEIFERFLLPMVILIMFVVITKNANALNMVMDSILSTVLTIIF